MVQLLLVVFESVRGSAVLPSSPVLVVVEVSFLSTVVLVLFWQQLIFLSHIGALESVVVIVVVDLVSVVVEVCAFAAVMLIKNIALKIIASFFMFVFCVMRLMQM